MREFFKPEDFGPMIDNGTSWIYVAEVCNRKLSQLVESWPVVYGSEKYLWQWAEVQEQEDTHTARLAFIEEIKKDPCKHEPEHVFIGPETGNWSTKCKHCNVELVAEWRAK